MLNDVDWEEPVLKRWMSSIVKEGTRKSYKTAFRNYAKFTGLSASAMIDEAIEDSKRDEREKQDIVLQRLLGFYSYLKDLGKSEWYANTSVQSMRSFYGTFNIFVKLKKKSRLPKPHAENHRIRVTPQLLRQFLDTTKSLRDRAIMEVLFQSGLDCSSLCGLTYGDVSKGLELDESPMRIPSDENRLIQRPKSSSSNTQFYTFIGRDAIESLKVYIRDIEAKGFKFSENTPLFFKEGTKSLEFEPMTTDIVQDLLRSLAVRMGYLKSKKDKGRNPISSHSFRESFSSILLNNGVPDSIVDFLLGHEIGSMSEAYKRTDFEKVKEMYAQNEPKLSIGNNGNGNGRIREIQEENKELRKQIEQSSKTITVLLEKIDRLENGLNKMIADTDERFTVIEDKLKIKHKIIKEFT